MKTAKTFFYKTVSPLSDNTNVGLYATYNIIMLLT